ncbi:site-specific integrase [archaeon]|jgi:integrase|nr:site-specific integrase [archaeon]MBT3577358.1 site-specific integrase [archaeon]MBT6820399.1 site-specific integrase [archaeon]MBT6955756.1 site-specific integrase [archaeon]MBT7025213.1 site-specific integrase [archaeon]
MKIDPYNHEGSLTRWKDKVRELGGIPDISRQNSEIILKYMTDMELGINTSLSSKKGARSFVRINTIRQRLTFLAKKFKEILDVDDMILLTEQQVCSFFVDMRGGKIKRQDGRRYKATRDFVKIFKAFWHWWQKVARKAGQTVEDITTYLDSSGEKPEWVYLNEEQVRIFCDNCNLKYRVLVMFLFDTGIRSPTELLNVKVSDLSLNCKELNIRDEVSKTFGRRIKLMLCSELVRRYIKENELGAEDYLFKFSPYVANRYLKRLARKLFGDEKSLAGQNYSDLTMYDFRHCSCCYWLVRYKSESALKFRFGWKKSDKIHYYSEMLGMRDTISEEDLLIDVTKTELEQRLVKSENRSELLEAQVEAMKRQLAEIYVHVNKLHSQAELIPCGN